MELHQLRYFVAVVDAENFTRAAEVCFVSQPSLSQQIAKLEQELGQRLFERLGRKVRITDAGRALYRRALGILSAVDEAKSSVHDATDWRSGAIAVAAIPTIAPYLLPELIQSFSKSFPKARLTVRENFTAEVVKDCLAGDADVGILALPLVDERLAVQPLFSEELLLVTPPRHRLAKKRAVLLGDLSTERFVLLSDIHCLGEQIVAFCNQHQCTPIVTCRTAQLLTVQEMVVAEQGVSLVPAMAARSDRSKLRSYRALAAPKPTRTIGMIWHKDRFQSPLVKQFIEMLQRRNADGRRPHRN